MEREDAQILDLLNSMAYHILPAKNVLEFYMDGQRPGVFTGHILIDAPVSFDRKEIETVRYSTRDFITLYKSRVIEALRTIETLVKETIHEKPIKVTFGMRVHRWFISLWLRFIHQD
jgi:hypothetical protein